MRRPNAISTVLTLVIGALALVASLFPVSAAASGHNQVGPWYDSSTWRLGPDSDGDTIPDSTECPSWMDPQRDSDNDGVFNCDDTDDDGDQIPTIDEVGLDTDGDDLPDFIDFDDDGDGEESLFEYGLDTDGDGIPNARDADDDGDGILSVDESHVDSDGDGFGDKWDNDDEDGPYGDRDNDLLVNADEWCVGTSEVDPDSDNDLVPDGREVDEDEPCALPQDSDGDGTLDVFDTDDDNDGVTTRTEADGYGVQPVVVTGECAPAGHDPATKWFDPDDDGVPNHLDVDSDDDGDTDLEEWPQHQSGGVNQPLGSLYRPRTDWDDVPDHDGDGIPDHLDWYDHDGPDADADGEGILNCDETMVGMNPFGPDSDGDGVPDDDEWGLDSDGDGIIDGLDADDDGDGIDTKDEGTFDTDGDGVGNHLDLDSDDDTHTDAVEGWVDTDGDWIEDVRDDDSDNDGVLDIDDRDRIVSCAGMIPDGWEFQTPCLDRDCDSILDIHESTAEVYESGRGYYRPALSDGPCAHQDYDCDGIRNHGDDDWTSDPISTPPYYCDSGH